MPYMPYPPITVDRAFRLLIGISLPIIEILLYQRANFFLGHEEL
jgi:hypothetical protein